MRTWAADGTPRAILTGHRGWVHGVAISPDGTWLATASNDGTVRTWAADGTPRAVLTGHQERVERRGDLPDGTWLATAGDDRTVRTWDRRRHPPRRYGDPGRRRSVRLRMVPRGHRPMHRGPAGPVPVLASGAIRLI